MVILFALFYFDYFKSHTCWLPSPALAGFLPFRLTLSQSNFASQNHSVIFKSDAKLTRFWKLPKIKSKNVCLIFKFIFSFI